MSNIPTWLSDPKGIPRSREEMERAIDEEYVIPPFRNNDEITVDLLLDYVDLKLDWYIPSVQAFEFVNFIRLCVGKEPENLNPKAHYFFIDCLFSSEEVKPYFVVRNIDYEDLKRNVLILATREFSKSVLLGYLILQMAVTGKKIGFGKVNFGVYVSDKLEKGNVTVMMDLLYKLYKQSAYLKSKFEYVHVTATKAVFIRRPVTPDEIKIYNKHIALGGREDEVPYRMDRQFALQGVGVSTGGRGIRDTLDRPDFAIFDDMLKNDEEANSPTILAKTEKVITKDVGGSLNGNGNFKILIGTAYHAGDPVYKRVEEGSWLPVVFPRAEQPPTDDLKEEDFISMWADRHTYANQRKDYLEAYLPLKRKNNPIPMRAYMQEFFCRVSNDADRLIPKQLEQWYNADDVWENAWNFNWYITTDYTTTGNGSSDRSGAFLWAVSNSGDYFLVDMVLRRMGLEEQYNNTFRMIESTNYITRGVEVGVEIDGQQVLHVVALKDRQFKKNIFIRFARQKGLGMKIPEYEGIRSKAGGGDKLWRLKATLPLWEDRKIWFPKHLKNNKDMLVLLDELRKTTPQSICTSSDDGLDCISQLMMMDIQLPPKDVGIAPSRLINNSTPDVFGRDGNRFGTVETGSDYNRYL